MATEQEVALAELGDRLEAARLAQGWTRAQVAETAGVRASVVMDAEYGAVVDGEQLRRLGQALGVCVSTSACLN